MKMFLYHDIWHEQTCSQKVLVYLLSSLHFVVYIFEGCECGTCEINTCAILVYITVLGMANEQRTFWRPPKFQVSMLKYAKTDQKLFYMIGTVLKVILKQSCGGFIRGDNDKFIIYVLISNK